ncbi:MAG: hypothetical protein AAGK78_06980, partial [Planctomycetota bacterium]
MSEWTPSTFQPIVIADPVDAMVGVLSTAAWYTARKPGDSVALDIVTTDWTEDGWLSFEGYNDSDLILQCLLLLSETAQTKVTRDASANADLTTTPPEGFTLTFALYPRVQARMRLPLTALRLDRWLWQREGALLKPMTGGKAITPTAIRHARLMVWSMGTDPQRFGITPLMYTTTEPPRLMEPASPTGNVLDDVGQSKLRDWPGRATSVDTAVKQLRDDHAAADSVSGFGDDRNAWGGFAGTDQLDATGFFRTHHDGRRWWLVDPDGQLFWSAGLNCVGVQGYAEVRGLDTVCDWLPARDGAFG